MKVSSAVKLYRIPPLPPSTSTDTSTVEKMSTYDSPQVRMYDPKFCMSQSLLPSVCNNIPDVNASAVSAGVVSQAAAGFCLDPKPKSNPSWKQV